MLETNNHQESGTSRKRSVHCTLDAIGWGLFFVWVGIAFLADVGWGVGLIGVGVIILGMLGVRHYLSGPDDGKTVKSNC